MSRIAATLLVALGDFGSSVATLLRARVRTRSDERPSDIAVLDIALDSGPGAESRTDPLEGVETRLAEEVGRQLALSALVERSPSDASEPWLDVLVVGDLAEPGVRATIGPLIDLVEGVAARRFANLLGRRAVRLVVMPLLALGESSERDEEARPPEPPTATSSERLLDARLHGKKGTPSLRDVTQALAGRTTPKVRTFLFESQTPKYILSRDELVSTTVAMVELLVLAGLRDSEQLASFLRDEAPRTPGAKPEPAPFGTFGVASVRVDADLIHAYCRNRASLVVVEAMRAGLDLGLSEREELARELRLPWDEARERLVLAARSDAAFEQVEKIVLEEAPSFPCPEIDPRDSPEDIKDRKFGDDWYRAVGGSIDQLIERLELRRMHELSAKIDAGGLAIARKRRQVVRETVNDWVWRGPKGWAAARSVLSLLRDESASREADTSMKINDLALPPMPTPEQLHRPVIALREEAERRPRPFRLWLTGLLLIIPAVLFGYQLLALLKYPLEAWDAPRWLIDVVSPPLGLIPTMLAATLTIVLTLRSVLRRHHKEIGEVRDDLRRSIQRLITGREGSVLAYYLARLELARELWVLRLARLDRRLFEAELERLDEVQRALDTLWDQLRAAQRQLGVRYLDEASTREDLSQIEPGGDLILRDAADGPLLLATYLDAVGDEEDLVGTFFERLSSNRPEWRREMPMADASKLRAFLGEVMVLPGPGELLVSDRADASSAARIAVEQVLTDLAARLSPSLGLSEASIAGQSIWVITAPSASTQLVDEALSTLRAKLDLDAFASEWLRLTSPRDDGRVYLSALVTHLPWAAIGALSR